MSSPEPELRPNYLRRRAQENLESEIRSAQQQIDTTIDTDQVDRRAMRGHVRRLQAALDREKVPDLSPHDLDYLKKQQAELEAAIVPDMLSRDEMMRKPPGAVGRNIEFEKKHKARVLKWKRNQLLLNRGSDDPDIANIETLRPQSAPGIAMDEAFINRKREYMIPGPQYQAGHEQVRWNGEPSESEQRIAELEAKLDAMAAKLQAAPEKKRNKPKRQRTEAQKAADAVRAQKARERHARQQAEQAERAAAPE